MQQASQFTLLYVEDEAFIRQNAVLFLEDIFHEIYEVDNAFSALEIYEEKKPDIIITDISMPKMNGLEMCERIREKDTKTPIIITTAHTNTEYLLKAVELQLVKYLLKPLDDQSLHEAIQLCFDKLQQNGSNIIQLNNRFTYDSFNHTLLKDGSVVKLTNREALFLKLLIKYRDRVCTYTEIENYVFGGYGMSEDALKTVVKNLRKKSDSSLIENHSKVGYKIVIDL